MQSSRMVIHIPLPMQPISPTASYGFMLFEIRWCLLLRKQSFLACDNKLPPGIKEVCLELTRERLYMTTVATQLCLSLLWYPP